MAGQRGDAEAWGQLARLAALRFALIRYGRYLAMSNLFAMPGDEELELYLGREGGLTGPTGQTLEVLDLRQHSIVVPFAAGPKRYKFQRGTGYAYAPYRLRSLAFTVPETGRYLRDHVRDGIQRYLDDLSKIHGTWYTALADNHHYRNVEYCFMTPNCSHQLFMAHAWVAGTPAGELERYIDEPWTPLGDLYYMHKLAETIKAYRGVRWE
jgi:hypothetical protein